MGSGETEEGVAAAQEERTCFLVDPETHGHLADGSLLEQEKNRTGCLGTPKQKELRVRFFLESSDQAHEREQRYEPMGSDHQKKGNVGSANFIGPSDQDHQKELGVRPMGKDHQKKCR